MPFFINFLLWGHRELDAPDKNNKIRYRECEVRQELYQRIKYVKKPNRMLGFFYCLKRDLDYLKQITFFEVLSQNF